MAAAETGGKLHPALHRVASGERLGQGESRSVMESILAGEATPAQVGGLLVGMRVRGETAEEIAGFVEALRGACPRIELSDLAAVDLCGTGGDGSGSINISTAASLLAAAAGAKVAKHGNRSASSRSGSADVLESLGIPIDLPPLRVKAAIEELGFGFLFAPSYHPAMRHAAQARRELGVRTAFNLLGPLSNPAGVRRQLIGVCEDRLRRLLGEVLLSLGSERVWLVHSRRPDGGSLDEIGIAGPTRVTELRGGSLREFEIVPEDAGLQSRPGADLRGGDPGHNARRLEAVLSGNSAPEDLEAVMINAGAALVIAGRARDLREGVEDARGSIESGRARALLDELRAAR